VGIRNGYFTKDEEEEIIRQINDSNTDVLLVALGAPKQENGFMQTRKAQSQSMYRRRRHF